MRRAIGVVEKAAVSPGQVVSTVTLNFEDRYRRRVRLSDDAGDDFLLDLAQATRLNDGDGLELDSGGVLMVRAAIEDVMEASAHNMAHAARLAWHVGNRHTPLEVLSDGRLRLQYDHVLQHMLEGLGAIVVRKQAPFAPEPGAYDAPHASPVDTPVNTRHHHEESAHEHIHSHNG